MPLRFEGLAPVLIVDSVAPSVAFFRDRLGFAVVAEVAHEGQPGFAMLERDEVTVMVQSHASLVADVGEDATRAINAISSARGAAAIYLTVSDIDLLVPAVADADVIVPLRKTFYGMHEIMIREPGGHAVTFASRLPGTPSPT